MCRKIICLISFVLLLNLVSSFSVASAAGLVNRYSFIDGDTIAVDSVGGKNGTLTGTAVISENKLTLGSSGYASLPADTLPTSLTSVTFEGWFELSTDMSYSRLFDFGDTQEGGGTSDPGGYYIHYCPRNGENPRTQEFTISTLGYPGYSAGELKVRGTPIIPLNTRTHIACVYDGSTTPKKMILYNNGVRVAETDVTYLLSDVHRVHSYIGRSCYEWDNPLKGTVDEFRIYDTALTDAEVLASYNAGSDAQMATNPNPPSGSTVMTQDVNLSWTPAVGADKHDVYIGTNKATVASATRGNPQGVLKSQDQVPNNYLVEDLLRGTTYYWRIDEIDDAVITRGNVWNFYISAEQAWEPDPFNNETCVVYDPCTVLSWNPGSKATQSKLYFGTSPGSLTLETTINHTGAPRYSYDKTGLAAETDYYWEVNEVNVATATTWPGDVWTFKTIPDFQVTDPNLVGWWPCDCPGIDKIALDWSGHGKDGTVQGATVVAGHKGWALNFNGNSQYVELPIGNTISTLDSATITAWANFANIGGGWQRIFDFCYNEQAVYMFLSPSIDTNGVMRFAIATTSTGESIIDAPSALASSGWHHVAVVIDSASMQMQLYLDGAVVASGSTTTLPSALGNTTQNWLGRSRNHWEPYFVGMLDDFRIYNRAMSQADIGKIMSPLEAWLPNPDDGAIDVEPTPTLSWTPGAKAVKHDVYFGDNWDAVNDANSSDPSGPGYVYKGRQDSNTFDITTELTWGQTYYWRVDEFNDPTLWRGNIWSFTVRNFLHVDDFESYTNSDPNIIFKIWKDGVGYSPGNGTGSQVGYRDPNYAEVTIVHGGAQSMPFDYNNTKTPYYSEASRTFDTPQNWTAYGPYSLKALSLWFRGYPASVGSFNSSTYTITASGTDIWDVPDIRHPSRFHDEFHYAYKEVTEADEEDLVTIVAKVESITNTNAWAKAGVMIRDSLDPNSTHGMMCVSPTSGVAFQRRLEKGGASAGTTTTGITAPRWVKLILDTWYGNIRAYHSATGNADDWTWIGDAVQPLDQEGNPSMTFPRGSPLYVGLALTSHDASATCEAVFSNVQIIAGAMGEWQHQDIGIKVNVPSPLYVTLQDSTPHTATVTNSDSNMVLQNTWQQWDIALSDFAGVDPEKIKKMTIGVGSGSADGTGTIYVDDIRLYVPRCMPDRLRAAADFTGSDCTVNYQDLAILTDNWLISEYQVTPANPGTTNLAAYYAFEGNFNDTSGGYNGEPNGATTVADAVRGGQVANFEGSNDYVVLPIGSLISSLNSTTIATWVNFSNTGGSWQRIFDFGNDTTVYMFLTPRLGDAGAMRFAITTSSAGGESQLTAPSTLATGWHHVAVVINGADNTMQLYLDGAVVASGTTATLPSALGNTTQNWLGRSQWDADAYFSGRLDDFRIYNRALSQGEVAYLASKTTPFNQPLYLLLTPQNSAINLYNDGTIDLRDYAGLADTWLEILLWP